MEFDRGSCIRLIKSCTSGIWQIRQVHLLLLKKGIIGSAVVAGNCLLQSYVKCSHLEDARQLFDEMSERNCFTWNTLIEGYMKSGEMGKAMEVFKFMPERDNFSWNMVMSGFSEAGDLDAAKDLFDAMPIKNSIAWSSLIGAYKRYGHPREALQLYKDMNLEPLERKKADLFVLATVIGVCTDMGAVECGKQIHARIITDGIAFDSVLSSSLTNFYAKCADLDSAAQLLNSAKEPDDFSLSALISGYANLGKVDKAKVLLNKVTNPCAILWNSLISGLISNNQEIKAINMFNEMRNTSVCEDSSTLVIVLGGCSSLRALEAGKEMHSHASKLGLSSNLMVAGALVDMYYKCWSSIDACKFFSELRTHDTILLNTMITVYSNCGEIELAKRTFDLIPSKSLISWNSIVTGLGQNGCALEALHVFCEMNRLDLRMDNFTVNSAISACASISAFDLGEQIFGRSYVIGVESDPVLSTSVIDFYCKAGFVEEGRKIFDRMLKTDHVPWNTMLMGYATNGHGSKALSLFEEMRHSGLRLTGITFTGVLSACSHCGLIEEGQKWFNAMKKVYHINPEIEHYSCMVDLLSRSARLYEAVDLIKEMPFKADAELWSSVLRGCASHGDKTLGRKVAENIIELDPQNQAAYVQLSGIFADSGDWKKSAEVRDEMKELRVHKNPGFSWAGC